MFDTDSIHRQPGEFADATILFEMKMSTINIEGVKGTAHIFCDPPEGFPTLSLFVGMESLEVGSFSVSDVKLKVDMYSRMKIVEPEKGDAEDAAASIDNERFFKGSVSGKASVEGVEASVFFSFDTDAKTFHLMANLTIAVDPIELTLRVGLSGGNGCDAVNGNFVDGEVTVKFTPENIITGSVRGAKHCESHPQMMHALGRKPPLVSPKYDEIAEFLDPERSKKWDEIHLEMLFPMMTIHGTVNPESRTELAPGLYLESATISLYNYVIDSVDHWAFEVTGMVSFESVNPTLAKKKSGGSGGLAAELYFAFAGSVADAKGLHNVRIGVTASIEASFGASPQIAVKGRVAFAWPCVNIRGELMLSLSELGEGFDSQANIGLNATVGCDADQTPHVSVMSFQGGLVGGLKTDMVDIAKLEITGSLHNNAKSDGLYFVGKISGEVSAVTAISGLEISAELDINSSVPLFVINVNMSYTSPVVDVELHGSVQLPLDKCKGGDAFSLDGIIVAHLGAAGDIVARAHGSKKCEANATAIYGYTYHVSFQIERTTIQMGSVVLGLDDLTANFFAKVIGSDSRGGEGMMSWFGSLNATISTAIPGLASLSQFEFYVSAAFVMKESTMSLGLEFGFSYESEVVTFDAAGKIALADESGDGLKLKTVSADGTFSLKMGSDIDVTLHAHFSLKTTPEDDGRDMKVILSSGDETIKIGGIDLGTFSIVADRYQAVDGKKEGWKGLLTSDSNLIDTMVAFDTRDGTFAVQASITLELGPVTLTLEAGHDCSGDQGATRVGVTAVLKDYPKAKLIGEYRKYCGDNDHGLEWSVEAGAKLWEFGAGISLRDISVTIDERKVGGLLVFIEATVDFSAGTASPLPLPSLSAEITIDDGSLSMQVTGDLVVPLGQGITLTGNVSFTFPCDPDSPTTVQLGIEIDSAEIKLQDAYVRGEWYCVQKGVEPPANAKLSEYTAAIGVMQVGGFGLRDVHFSMYNTQGEQGYKGHFKGTVQIIPELSITVSVPFGKQDVTVYEIGVDSAFKIGDVNVGLKGHGKIKSPCKEMGDLLITIDVDVTNIPVDWMPRMSGSGRFESNCGDEYLISVTIDINKIPKMSVGKDGPAPKIPSGAEVTFSVHVKGGETTFQLSYMMALDESGDAKFSVFLEVMVQTRSINIGVKIENVDFGQLFSSVGKAAPGSGVEETSPVNGASASAQGAATGALGGALGEVVDENMVASLGGFSNMINAMHIPRAMALFSMLPDKSISLTISLYGVKLFGLSMEIFVHAVSASGVWDCFVYIGFLDIKNGFLDFPQPWAFISLIINMGVFLLGGGLTKLGFSYATGDIILHPQILEYSPIRTNIVRSGFGLIIAQDLEVGLGIGSLLLLFNKAVAGDCKNVKSAFRQLVCDDMETLDLRSYPTTLPLQGTLAFGHTYASKNGVLMSKPTDKNKVLWKQLTVEVEIDLLGPSFALMAEVVAEITFDHERNIVSELKVKISVKIDTVAIALELALAMKLKGESQIWANPFGSLPHMGIVFPLSLVIGVGINLQSGVPFITRFEIEAGILGCATPVMYKGKRAVTAQLGDDGEYEYVPDVDGERRFNRMLTPEEEAGFMHEADDRAALGFFGGDKKEDAGGVEASLTIPGLVDYSCAPGDDKGSEPTVIKIALSIVIGVVPKFGFMMIIRNFYLSRLIFMTLKKPPGKALKTMAPILDIFTAKKFDVSVNSAPFPVKLYSGTVIQAGILIDIEKVAILGIPIIRRAYFRFSVVPVFLLEAHIYIEPIRLAPLIEITGLQGAQKYKASQKAAKARKEAAEREKAEAKKDKILEEKALREAEERIAADKAAAIAAANAAATGTVTERKVYYVNSSWIEHDTICGNEKCFTCGRAEEGSGLLTLECADETTVISNVTAAMFGVAADQPDWQFTKTPELCDSPEPRAGRMARTNTTIAAQVVAAKCVGKAFCSIDPSRQLFGVPSGFDHVKNKRNGLALSVKVQCTKLSDAEIQKRKEEEDSLSLACADGCLTCVSESRSQSPNEMIIIGCHPDGIITGIEDAVYGAEDEQPPWMYDEAVGMCMQPSGVIPKGDMCKWNTDRVKVQLRRACAGRSKCKLEWSDVDELFPVDACPGKSKRLSVIARCQKSEMPREADSEVRPNSFGMTHYEERLLMGKASGALIDSYQARVAFETSPTVLASSFPKSLSEFSYTTLERRAGVNVGASAAIVRRFLSTFTLRSDEGIPGVNIWQFRVAGDPSFWKLGGVLALYPLTTHKDECDAIGGCVMHKCARKVHDDHGAVVGCVFSVNLKAGVMYQLHVYGVSDRVIDGASISVEFKPPAHCLLHVNCDNPAAIESLCQILDQTEMPFQKIKTGELPMMSCEKPSLAEVTTVEVETKPFCMSPGLYGEDVSRCWPGRHNLPNAGVGMGCQGTYHVNDAASENLLVARKTGRRGADVEVLDDGECMFTSSSAAKHLKVDQIVRLDFEEGRAKTETPPIVGVMCFHN